MWNMPSQHCIHRREQSCLYSTCRSCYLQWLPSARMHSEGTVCLLLYISLLDCLLFVRLTKDMTYVLNGQWRSEISNGFLWNYSIAKLEREKANMQIHNGRLTTVWSIRVLCVPRRHQKMQRRACIASRMLSSSVVSPRQTLRETTSNSQS